MSADQFDLEFNDVELAVLNVKIGTEKYVLKEAYGDVVCRYRNAVMTKAKMSQENGLTGFEGLADVEPFLVSMCLFRLDGTSVEEPIIRGWKNKILKTLFSKIKSISDMDEDKSLEDLEKEKTELEKEIAKKRKGETNAKN